MDTKELVDSFNKVLNDEEYISKESLAILNELKKEIIRRLEELDCYSGL